MSPRVRVQKFGGTSVSTPERREMVVEQVRRARDAGYAVAIVVSAMGRRGDPYATDTLLDLLRADGGAVAPGDYTLAFVTGEIISVALMSHTLKRAGIPAVGLTGAQARIFTDGHPTEAEVIQVDASRLLDLLGRGEVPVITGGQGIVSDTFDYNTLGRGASDTSGVVVGVALGAERVEIFTDVEGVATADPRIVPTARTIDRIGFARMHELARFGAKVVHARAVKAGWDGATPVVVRSTFSDAPGTWIGNTDGGEPRFSGVASLAPFHTVTVPAGSVDQATLGAWERRRLIMSLLDARSGRVVLGAPDARELEAALAEAGLEPSQRAEQAWVSVIGDAAALRAGADDDLAALAAAGVHTRFHGGGDLRRTYVVDPSPAAVAVRLLHDRWAGA